MKEIFYKIQEETSIKNGIFASTNLTGSSERGGDWYIEWGTLTGFINQDKVYYNDVVNHYIFLFKGVENFEFVLGMLNDIGILANFLFGMGKAAITSIATKIDSDFSKLGDTISKEVTNSFNTIVDIIKTDTKKLFNKIKEIFVKAYNDTIKLINAHEQLSKFVGLVTIFYGALSATFPTTFAQIITAAAAEKAAHKFISLLKLPANSLITATITKAMLNPYLLLTAQVPALAYYILKNGEVAYEPELNYVTILDKITNSKVASIVVYWFNDTMNKIGSEMSGAMKYAFAKAKAIEAVKK